MRARTRAQLVGLLVATGLVTTGLGPLGAPAHAAGSLVAAAKPGKPHHEPKKPSKSKKPGKPKGGHKHPKKKEPGLSAPSIAGTSVSPGGVVSLSVSAQGGAGLVVREDSARTVASGTASGSVQTFSWSTSGGTHTYSVTASRGGSSRTSSVTVTVDTTPPPLRRLDVKPGRPADPRSTVAFTTDPGTAYRILVDGRPAKAGNAERARVERLVDVPNGRHRIRIELRDAVGNLATGAEPVRVDVTDLALKVRLLSQATDHLQVVRVQAPPTVSRGAIRIGESVQPFHLTRGSARVRLKLTDGTYDNGRITVRDPQGRKGSFDFDEFNVDTTAPTLEVEPDRAAASDGQLAVDIATDKGVVVTWKLLDTAGALVTSGTYVAAGGVETVGRDVPQGIYRLEVSATDPYGRTTTAQESSRISPDARPIWQFALGGLLALALLTMLGAVAVLALVGARRRRRAAAGAKAGAMVRQRAGSEPETDSDTTDLDDEPQVAKETEPVSAYQEADELVRSSYETLTALRQVAQSGAQMLGLLLPEVSLLPHEKALYTIPARLVETTDGGQLVEIDEGDLVVTDMRYAFVGEQARDWFFALVESVRDDGDDRTLLKRWHHDEWTGFAYADPELTRLYLDFAMALHHGRGEEFLEDVTRGLRDLELGTATGQDA